MTPADFWRRAIGPAAATLVILAVAAYLSPAPFPTDQQMMERVGQGGIIPGCADLNCFRMLVPVTVEMLPGPSLPRWRAYAVIANVAAAVAAGRLALALGLAPRAVMLTIWLSALGAGSLSTVYHPYNADSFVLFLAPVTTFLLVKGRNLAAGAVATAGIFAKEFGAAPLYIAAAAAALRRDWAVMRTRALLAVSVTAIWIALQLVLMNWFNYSYNANPSSRPLEGGYLRVWLHFSTPATVAFALSGVFGGLTLAIPVGWTRAPLALRHLALGAIPAAMAFMYVATPERALWNFFFLAVPLGAIVIAELPSVAAWIFVAAFALANFRIGAQIPSVPASRYALAISVVIAIAALIRPSRAHAAAETGLDPNPR